MIKKNINLSKFICPTWIGILFFPLLTACADKTTLNSEKTGRETILNDFSHFNFQNIVNPSGGKIPIKPPVPTEELDPTPGITDPNWVIDLLIDPEAEREKVNCNKREEVLVALGLEPNDPLPEEASPFIYKGLRCLFGNAQNCPLTSINSIGIYFINSQHFRQIPPHIRCLTALEYISIVDFQLGAWGLNEFISPDVLKDLKNMNIKGLRLEGNQFNAFPLSLFELNNLERLDLSNNTTISTIPNNINLLTKLTHLYLDGLSLNNIQALSNSRLQLKYLSIRKNKQQLIIQASDKTLQVDSLILQNSKIYFFSDAFQEMQVKYLDLSENNITTIPPAFDFKNSSLTEIHLNGLTEFPYNLLLEAKNLKILDLSKGKITNLSEDLVRTAGLNPIFKCPVLKSINLSQNEINTLHWSIGACTQKLELQNNKITSINDLLYNNNNNNNLGAEINLEFNQIKEIDLKTSYPDKPSSVWGSFNLQNNSLTFNGTNWAPISNLNFINIQLSKTQFDVVTQTNITSLLPTKIEFK